MIRKMIRQARNSTEYSLDGLGFLLRSEFAARLEVYAFVWIFGALVLLGVAPVFLVSTIILFLALLAVEALNTAIEEIIDRVSPEISPTGKHAKDLGSFAVMCLLAVNLVHLLYVLTRIDFATVDGFGLGEAKWVILSTALFFTGLYYFTGRSAKPLRGGVLGVLTGVFLLGLGVWIAADLFTGQGFDEKVVYHLRTGVEGAGLSEYAGLMALSVAFVLFALFLAYLVYDLIGHRRGKISTGLSRFIHRDIRVGVDADAPKTERKPGLSLAIGTAAVLGGILLHPLTSDLKALSDLTGQSAPDIAEYDFYLAPTDARLTEKKNVVFLYLESFERTYFDQEVFPGLTPNLMALEKEAISVTGMKDNFMTTFTIAGLVSTQCGIPLYAPSSGNTMGAYDAFMPNATCLGDVLKENGYHMEFMGGADPEFAGKGKFFESHSFDRVIGRPDWEERYSETKAFSSWGLHDDYLFKNLIARFETLSQRDEPFGLVGLTLDTHHPDGHVSESCKSVKYGDGSNRLLNVLHCNDSLIVDFVDRLRASEYADNTLIVVMSDHLGMRNSIYDQLKNLDRNNLFFIIDPSETSPRVITRANTKMDVGATILGRLGMQNAALGFGRDLMGSESTLAEEKKNETQDFLVRMSKPMQRDLWNFPQLGHGLMLNEMDDKIRIGTRTLEAPFLLSLNSQTEITDIEFGHISQSKRKGQLFKNLPEDAPYLWIDRCEEIAAVVESVASSPADDICIARADGANAPASGRTLPRGERVRLEDI